MRQYLYAALGLGLLGCGSEPPAFIEKPVFYMNVNVEGESLETSEVAQEPLPSDRDMETILAELEGGSSDDVVEGQSGAGDDTAANDDDAATNGGSSPASSGNPSSGGSDEWASPDFSRPSAGEMKACARISGVEEGRLKVAGSKSQVTMGAADILVAKITGNQNRLALDFRGEAGTTVAGICLFVAGNEAEVELKSNLTIGRVFYTARGNQSRGLIVAEDSGNVENMVVDLSGNQATLNVSGVEQCPTARLKGHDASFLCIPR